jgi:hypothetical protein
MVHEVFISYSTVDKTIADAICAKFEESKIRCWIAPRDVLPGENYPAAIINAIEQSRIMVLVFSSKSNKSVHVIRELTKAVDKGVIIIPFRIEDITPSKDMEYLIGIPHWLDALTPPLEDHITKLLHVTNKILSKKPDFEEIQDTSRPVSGAPFVQPLSGSVQPPSVPKFCPICGKPLQFENVEICPSCGVRIQAPKSPPPKQRGRNKIGQYLIIGIVLIFIFVVLAAVFSYVVHGTEQSGSVKPGDTVVVDYTLYDIYGNPVLTSSQQTYTTVATKSNNILYSKQLSMTAGQNLTKSIYPVSIYTNSSGWSKEFALFSTEYDTINQALIGMKTNNEKRIQIPNSSIAQEWSATQLTNTGLDIRDLTIGDILAMGVSGNPETKATDTTTTYIRVGQVTSMTNESLIVNLGYPYADIRIVSINSNK